MKTNHPLCSEPGCVCLAGPGGKCTVHAMGYRVHESPHELRCWFCRRKINRGEVYRQTNGVDVRHVRKCKEHPETVKERERRKKVKPMYETVS